MFRTVATLAEDAGGEILSGDPGAGVGAISTDTEEYCAGSLLHCPSRRKPRRACFRRGRHQKRRRGCNRIGAQRLLPGTSAAVIRVSDTLFALGELARRRRMRFDIPVIAVSGSNGKTSTKEMIAAIFSRTRKVLKNRGNFNNLIGLPLTLLGLERRTQRRRRGNGNKRSWRNGAIGPDRLPNCRSHHQYSPGPPRRA